MWRSQKSLFWLQMLASYFFLCRIDQSNAPCKAIGSDFQLTPQKCWIIFIVKESPKCATEKKMHSNNGEYTLFIVYSLHLNRFVTKAPVAKFKGHHCLELQSRWTDTNIRTVWGIKFVAASSRFTTTPENSSKYFLGCERVQLKAATLEGKIFSAVNNFLTASTKEIRQLMVRNWVMFTL